MTSDAAEQSYWRGAHHAIVALRDAVLTRVPLERLDAVLAAFEEAVRDTREGRSGCDMADCANHAVKAGSKD